MHFNKSLLVAAAFAAVGFAQDSGVCDDQNDNGIVCSNGTPVSSDGVALSTVATNTITGTAAATSSGLSGRLSLISSTDTDIIVSTNTDVVYATTSLPHSL